MPEIQRSEPPYLQVVRHFRDQITSGSLAEGTTLPSVRQIAHDWTISKATATKVIATLRAERLVVGLPGIGTIVRTESLYPAAHDRMTTVMLTGQIYPEGHYAKIVSAALVAAPDRVSEALGLSADFSVIRRQRITYSPDDQPLSASVSWFDGALAELAPRLLDTDRIIEGTPRYIEDCTGRVRSPRVTMNLFADAATGNEADELQIEAGAPVQRGENWYWDTNGAVIEYGESVAIMNLKSTFELNLTEKDATS